MLQVFLLLVVVHAVTSPTASSPLGLPLEGWLVPLPSPIIDYSSYASLLQWPIAMISATLAPASCSAFMPPTLKAWVPHCE